MIKLNLNSLLVILGGLGVFAPDVTVVATWLDGLGVHWLSYVAKGLGFVAVFFAAAPLAVPKLRAFLALVGLATPSGSVVPSPTQTARAEPAAPDSTMPPTSGEVVVPNPPLLTEIIQPVVGKQSPATSASKPDRVGYKRYAVTLKRSDGIMERQGTSTILRTNWSESDVLTRLRADGYTIGGSAKLQGWPGNRFEVRSMRGVLVLETDETEGGFIHPVASLVGLFLAGSMLLLMVFLYGRMAKADDVFITTVPPLPTLVSPTTPPPAPPAPTSEPTPTPIPSTSATPATSPENSKVIDPKYPEEAATDYKTANSFKSKYGGCKGNFCIAPVLALQVFQYVPSTGNMVGGVAFNGGYGILWHTIIDLGVAFYGGVQFSRDRPFEAQGLMMINVANYFAFGPGFQMVGQATGPAKFLLTICFAANWIPGIATST
jgi:hypothetical protein